MEPTSIAIVGTTLWGTTLSLLLANQSHKVKLIARTSEEADNLESKRRHLNRLPEYEFPNSLQVTSDWEAGLADAQMILFAVPCNSMRVNAQRASAAMVGNPIVISASKGLEKDTSKRMSIVLTEELGIENQMLCVLSGPNLAREIVKGLPTSTVIASSSIDTSLNVQSVFNTSRFRVYTNNDVVGTEIAGALKNVIAIGAGICDGMKLGDNAKAGFINRGMAEMARLGVACGANSSTFAGNAGLGDLLATCYSTQSRNYRIGIALAEGRTSDDAIASLGGEIAEGVLTANSATALAQKLMIDTPIIEMTNQVLNGSVSPQNALKELMSRSPKSEN